MIMRIAGKTRVLGLDYRLAPEHPYPAANEDCLNAYHRLLALGVSPDSIVLGGDSVGATLVLMTLLRLRDTPSLLPTGAFLLSPHADLVHLDGGSYTYNDGMPVTRRDRHNIMPADYIAFTFIISAHSHHRAIRSKPDGTTPTRSNRHNIVPAAYITLVMLIPTHSRHRTVRFKTDCMSITRVRRHMNITSRDRHNIAPDAYITLAKFIITNSNHRSVRLKANGMTTARSYGIFRPPFHL